MYLMYEISRTAFGVLLFSYILLRTNSILLFIIARVYAAVA